jgi:hypothetical protein
MTAVAPKAAAMATATHATPPLQRQCACAETGESCSRCAGEQQTLEGSGRHAEVRGRVPGIVNRVLTSPGEPLERPTRDLMEQRFAHDFSQVRVHTDERAASSSLAVDAQAYTLGNHVVFGADRYRPQTPAGRSLLGHELAHVVQQSYGGSQMAPASAEREADAAGDQIASGRPASIRESAGLGLQRREASEEELRKQREKAADMRFPMSTGQMADWARTSAAPSTAPAPSAKSPNAHPPADRRTVLEKAKDDMGSASEVARMKRAAPDVLAANAQERVRQQQQDEEKRRQQQEKEDAVDIKRRDDEQRKTAQRWTVLGALMPDSVQPYYKDPSREVTNPVYRMHAETNTGAAFAGARLGRDTTAAVSAAVGAVMVVAEGALALDALVMISLEAAAASTTATPVVSIIVNSPIAAEQLAVFAGETILSIVIAGSVKRYIESLATPEGVLNLGVQIYLHGTAFSSSGGSSGQGVGQGRVKSLTPDGKLSIVQSQPPTPSKAAASPGGSPPAAPGAPQPQVSRAPVPVQFPVVAGVRPNAHDNDAPRSNVTPIRPLQPAQAPPVARASGQDFDAAPQVQTFVGAKQENATVAAAGAGGGSSKTPASAPPKTPVSTSAGAKTSTTGTPPTTTAGAAGSTSARPRGTNVTVSGSLSEDEFKQNMPSEPGLYLYELIDANGNHLKWGTAANPYSRFNQYVTKEGQTTAQMKVYRAHPRFQSLAGESQGIEDEIHSGRGGQNVRTNTRTEMRAGDEWGEILETPADTGSVLVTIRRW